jgi:hypothetical protein
VYATSSTTNATTRISVVLSTMVLSFSFGQPK